MHLKHRRMSISKRIALIYSAILFSILMIFTIPITYLMRDFFIEGSKEELLAASTVIEDNIKHNGSYQPEEFEKMNPSFNIIYSIYDEKGGVLYSNKPGILNLDIPLKDEKLEINERVLKHDTVIVYLNKRADINGKVYYIQVAKSMGKVRLFRWTYFKIFVYTGLLAIVVCLFSGLYISNKVLRPIRNITDTARELTAKSLDKRISIDGPNDELKDLANTFNSMLERLETDFEKQRRFVYDASHELRTPLAVIYSNINMLNRWGKDDPQVLSQALETLKSETENMSKLIENLLYLAKSDNNILVLNKEEFLLNMLLKEVVDEMLLIHSDYRISYVCDDDYKLTADYNAVKQILRILTDNSIKFSCPPGDIVINVQGKENGTLIIVKDNGCGIPAECLPYVFDRFYRVDESRTKATGGTGLGLAIAKQIVQSHNGMISAESKPGEGTRIEVFLPF